MVNDVINDVKERMDKAIASLKHDLSTIRTGRASPALVEELKVEYYGMPTPLQQLALITIPEAQQILIKPYNRGDILAIEKAIAKSDKIAAYLEQHPQFRLKTPYAVEG
jgi:ribosome recycling factor